MSSARWPGRALLASLLLGVVLAAPVLAQTRVTERLTARRRLVGGRIGAGDRETGDVADDR